VSTTAQQHLGLLLTLHTHTLSAHHDRTTSQIALYLLIWGEAANLRFCPEFLAWLYHKMAGELVTVMQEKNVRTPVFNSFLGDVIKPAYDILADQVRSSCCKF
jgi:1,3-beta-glucan synthase subunit FKS1, domain-1